MKAIAATASTHNYRSSLCAHDLTVATLFFIDFNSILIQLYGRVAVVENCPNVVPCTIKVATLLLTAVFEGLTPKFKHESSVVCPAQ